MKSRSLSQFFSSLLKTTSLTLVMSFLSSHFSAVTYFSNPPSSSTNTSAPPALLPSPFFSPWPHPIRLSFEESSPPPPLEWSQSPFSTRLVFPTLSPSFPLPLPSNPSYHFSFLSIESEIVRKKKKFSPPPFCLSPSLFAVSLSRSLRLFSILTLLRQKLWKVDYTRRPRTLRNGGDNLLFRGGGGEEWCATLTRFISFYYYISSLFLFEYHGAVEE